jgi:glycosyltransferase involved in cell wall biosynthesis
MIGEEPRASVERGGASDSTPKISVAMATYNGEHFLAEQLESLAHQTWRPDELVVSDDGSTDGTGELIRSFAAKAPFLVRLLANERNLGVNGNFDRAIAACNGEIILPCDQDDVWLPQKIEKMTDALMRHANAAMVISNSEIVDQNLQPIGRNLYAIKFPPAEHLHRRGVGTIRFLLTNWAVAGHTMAFRKIPALATPASRIAADCTYDFVRALVAGATRDVVTIPDRLTRYRRHEAQVTSRGALLPTRVEQLLRKIGNVFGNKRDSMSECQEFARDLLQVRDGLQQFKVEDGVIDFLQGHANIVLFQANLQSYSRFKRIPEILRCLIDGRYHKYARGALTALQDICVSQAGKSGR